MFPPCLLPSGVTLKETIHRFTQVVGKIRLAASPRRNHWFLDRLPDAL